MAINKKLFWIYLFIFAVGLCAGSFFEVSMTGAGKDQLMDALSGFFTDGNNFSDLYSNIICMHTVDGNFIRAL